jgi:endonuclease/exonuclease/phosphatase family metal-dependent hydrolase
LSLLVRSWNVFHGNTNPPRGGERMREILEVITEGDPDVVCLQEVPAWALRHLERWSGMTAVGSVARRPSVGPLPVPTEVGRVLNDLNRPLSRGFFEGQANATLLGPRARLSETHSLVLNDRRFRRAQARWLALSPLARIAWTREPRTCLAVRVELPDGRAAVVGNVHATSFRVDERLPDAEILRAATFIDALAGPDDISVLAGDLNVRMSRSWNLQELTGPEWGFDGDAPGVDHLLVRGVTATPTRYWPTERRRLPGGEILSDHAPVERRLG